MSSAGTVAALHLVSIGSGPPGLAALAARLSRRLAIPCRVASDGAAIGELPSLAGRGQLDADGLLARLEALASDASVVVGLTAQDVGIPIFTFVFGRARAGGRAALVSTARLDPSFYGLAPDPDLVLRRSVDEVLHELGHVAGLRHCEEAACLMRFAGSVEKADLRGSAFCAGCAARLPPWLETAHSLSGACRE
jgi:archaemetzincin